MAERAELTIALKTVAEGQGIQQTSQALKTLGSEAEQNSQRLQQLMKSGVSAAEAMRKVANEAAAAATTAARRPAGGRQSQDPLRDLSRFALGLAGVGSAAYLAERALRATVGLLGDSIEVLREHQRTVAGTSAAYSSWSSEITNLDAAFTLASKSSDQFGLTVGRMTAPLVLTGLKAMGSALDGINGALTGTARWLNEIGKNPVASALLTGAGALPGIGPVISQERGLGTALEQADREKARMLQERQLQRLREINELPSFDTASELARLARWDQIDAAARELNDAQNTQIGLQQKSVDLAAQEAELRLSMVPVQERLAALQRDVAEQQIRAHLAALPATEGLEDIESRIARDRLLLGLRGALSPEQRAAARQDIRGLTRNVLPQARLAAFDATRPVTLAGRAVERAGIEQQLFSINQERQLAQLTVAQETNGYLRQIAEQRTQAIQLTITLSGETFSQEIMNQVITTFHSARMAAENTASQKLAGA